MLIPIFNYHENNTPYVQIMDRNFIIEKFSPFYRAENYSTIGVLSGELVSVGMEGFIVVRGPQKNLLSGRIAEVLKVVDEWQLDLNECCLLQTQLMRFRSAPLSKRYEMWLAAGKKYFPSEKLGNQWVNSELELSQKEGRIWKLLETEKISNPPVDKIEFDLGGFEFERVLNILTRRSSFEAVNWVEIWFDMARRMPKDDRLYELAQQWLYYSIAREVQVDGVSDIFCALFDVEGILLADDDLLDFLYELIETGAFYSGKLTVPVRIRKNIYNTLEYYSDSSEYQQLILFILENNYFERGELDHLLSQLLATFSRETRYLSGRKKAVVTWAKERENQEKKSMNQRLDRLTKNLEAYGGNPKINSLLGFMRALM